VTGDQIGRQVHNVVAAAASVAARRPSTDLVAVDVEHIA
jgi:hypothetical protein